eukprot:CAMPEP_0118924246 /NCGR_PEP_ID=MMETSP1169-20130426/2468_1 /TAXON_ID=36882 /ORGANISM="Pyramimonas obovata, Strain CCMP722" /LENGTH=251 /DNA_ID=CAMNT_0006865339 /DNA_START=576 /DNA_END=1331 /DNA_ORIENTATION=-
MRLVCPTAPKQPVTLMLGPETFTKSCNTAWFDWTPSLGPEDFTKIDWKGVNASVSHVQQLIELEIANGIPSENIFVGGFSQGGTVALRAAMKYEKKLGGVIMLSSFVGPVDDLQQAKIPTANAKVPVFWGHCEIDSTVPIRLGRAGVDMLNGLGVPVEWKSYPVMSTGGIAPGCMENLMDIATFVTRILNPAVPPDCAAKEEPISIVAEQRRGFSVSNQSSLLAVFIAVLSGLLTALWENDKRHYTDIILC